MTISLHWLGHDGFRLDGPPVVYFDPFQISKGQPKADLIFVTHDHFDHCSPEDIVQIRGPKTVIVGPKEVAAKLSGPVEVMAAGQRRSFGSVLVKALPAYNVNKKFHPQKDGKLGFLITLAGETYYHAGDTDRIPEMDGLAPDFALLPVSGIYVMTAEEAVGAARAIKPKIAVPMHYGSIVGSEEDAKHFAQLLTDSGIEALVTKKE